MSAYRNGIASSLVWPIRGALSGVVAAIAIVFWHAVFNEPGTKSDIRALSGGLAVYLFANSVAWSLPAGFAGFLFGCFVPESLGQPRMSRR